MKKSLAKNKKIIIWIAVVVICGAAGFGVYKHSKSGLPATAQEAKTLVSRGDIVQTFQDSGELVSRNIVDITSKASGRIVELPVEEGLQVNQGDKLVVVQAGRSESEKYVPVAITSPLTGLVLRCVPEAQNSGSEAKFARVGDKISGSYDSNNPTCIMQVADMTQMAVKLEISEADIFKLKQGMQAKVTVDALPGKTFPALVGVISPQAEKGKRGVSMFRARVNLSGQHTGLRVGMSANVEITLARRVNALKMPIAALFEDKGRAFVYRKCDKGEPEEVTVKTGLRTDTEIEILSGLSEKEELLTSKPIEKK